MVDRLTQQVLGARGEDLVTRWLLQEGWSILQRRWRCRWGELDVVAYRSDGRSRGLLIFVEVKTRSDGNWDADGRLAVTPQKQEKLQQAAALFLTRHPHLTDVDCRFDVALVRRRSRPAQNSTQPLDSAPSSPSLRIQLGVPVADGDDWLTLDYIPDAFS
jgi:putative endonuclease